MSDTVRAITSETFDDFIKKGNVVIDFWAAWCGPCKVLSPVVEEVASETKNVKFGKVDIESQGELAQRFQVMSIPTLIFFKDKEQVNRISGAMPAEDLKKTLEENF
jgi:thioredoxin 1